MTSEVGGVKEKELRVEKKDEWTPIGVIPRDVIKLPVYRFSNEHSRYVIITSFLLIFFLLALMHQKKMDHWEG